MSPSPFRLCDGALLIADAHFCATREELMPLLEAIAAAKLTPPQLFLMGDVVDMLIGPLGYTRRINQGFIEVIDRIADRGVQVFYLEGNHDFLLDGVFDERVLVVPRHAQPLVLSCGQKQVYMLHGDYQAGLAYELYCRFIRSRAGLWLTHLLTGNFVGNRFLKRMEQKLQQKQLCRSLADFGPRRLKRLQELLPLADILIEGHFHQGVEEEDKKMHYINLPAFACGQSFVVVQSKQSGVLFHKKKWGYDE